MNQLLLVDSVLIDPTKTIQNKRSENLLIHDTADTTTKNDLEKTNTYLLLFVAFNNQSFQIQHDFFRCQIQKSYMISCSFALPILKHKIQSLKSNLIP